MTTVKPAKIIGEGGFGLVTDEGTLARKHFQKLDHLVRELVMLRYMHSSGYIVKIEKHNFLNMTICCRKWSCSLYDVMCKYSVIKPEHKLQIFKDVLYGLCHMHQAGLVHSDVTLSNILVNTKNWRACLCDLGLSSVTDYSRVKQTARGYAPQNPVPCQGHDMFGLTVCMIDLFAEKKICQRKTAAELRKLAQTEPKIPSKLRKIFCRMCPDDPRRAMLTKDVLWEVFKEKTSFELPDLEIFRISVSDQMAQFLRAQMLAIAEVYKINRAARCYRVLLQFFSGTVGSQLEEKYYDLYMVVALYIFACLYGKSFLTKQAALECLRGDYTDEEFLEALQVLVQDNNFVASSVAASK